MTHIPQNTYAHKPTTQTLNSLSSLALKWTVSFGNSNLRAGKKVASGGLSLFMLMARGPLPSLQTQDWKGTEGLWVSSPVKALSPE